VPSGGDAFEASVPSLECGGESVREREGRRRRRLGRRRRRGRRFLSTEMARVPTIATRRTRRRFRFLLRHPPRVRWTWSRLLLLRIKTERCWCPWGTVKSNRRRDCVWLKSRSGCNCWCRRSFSARRNTRRKITNP